MVKICAEPALMNGSGEIGVRCADHPHVYRFDTCSPQTADRSLLENLEHFGLETLGEEPDLVEEDRSAVSSLEEPGFRPPCVGE
ncbi:MAG TPA: hypothetical protein VKV41_17790, partial [Methylomirabilota bacterium]|nr:hypothetical protein [Methylomirabilota bacterium]